MLTNLQQEELLRLYQSVLLKTKKWPRLYWYNIDNRLERAAFITQYLFKDRLKMHDAAIRQAKRGVFSDNALDSMVQVVFNNRHRLALKHAFPDIIQLYAAEQYHYNELRGLSEVIDNFTQEKASLNRGDQEILDQYIGVLKYSRAWPDDFWSTVENPFYVAKLYTRYLFTMHLKYMDKRIVMSDEKFLTKYGLSEMQRVIFEDSYRYAIQNAFPEYEFPIEHDIEFVEWFASVSGSMKNYKDGDYNPTSDIESRYAVTQPAVKQVDSDTCYFDFDYILKFSKEALLKEIGSLIEKLPWASNDYVHLKIDNKGIQIIKASMKCEKCNDTVDLNLKNGSLICGKCLTSSSN